MAEICKSCEFWRSLSVSCDGALHGCHCLLETGVRNGLHGEMCNTFRARTTQRKQRKRKKKKGCDFFADPNH